MQVKQLIVAIMMIPFGIIQSIIILPTLLWMTQYNLDDFSIIVLLIAAMIPGYILKWFYVTFLYIPLIGIDEVKMYRERYSILWNILPIYEWVVGISETIRIIFKIK